MTYWIVQLLNSIAFGSLLFLLASGFTLIFGLMRIINIAHGSFFAWGAYVALSVMAVSNSFPLAVAAGSVTVMALGVAIQWGLLQRFALQPLPQVNLTMGLAFILSDAALVLWGGDAQTLTSPDWLTGPVSWGSIVYPKYRLFVIVAGGALAIGLWLFLERTKLGALIRAGVDDEEMARGMGINVKRLFLGVFAVGAFLAGFAGAIGGPFIGVFPGADFTVLPLALVVVILGGLGSLGGALVGSFVVGILDTFGRAIFPELSYFTLFAPMVIVLALRPRGLFGKD